MDYNNASQQCQAYLISVMRQAIEESRTLAYPKLVVEVMAKWGFGELHLRKSLKFLLKAMPELNLALSASDILEYKLEVIAV